MKIRVGFITVKKRQERVNFEEIVSYVSGVIPDVPQTAVILGTGLGGFGKTLKGAVVVPYAEIPHYPKSTVEGHSGELIVGGVNGKGVLAASGRFHLYEGHDLKAVTLPIRLFHSLGVKHVVVTNASGSVRRELEPETLMALKGHVDFTFREGADLPQINRERRFHSPRLLKLADEVAKREGIRLETGVYAWTLGPSFETPAEVKLIRELGGDAVGMSTVPEIREAGKRGLEVLGISCLTNYAAGIASEPLTHEEVIETASKVSEMFTRLVGAIVTEIGD